MHRGPAAPNAGVKPSTHPQTHRPAAMTYKDPALDAAGDRESPAQPLAECAWCNTVSSESRSDRAVLRISSRDALLGDDSALDPEPWESWRPRRDGEGGDSGAPLLSAPSTRLPPPSRVPALAGTLPLPCAAACNASSRDVVFSCHDLPLP